MTREKQGTMGKMVENSEYRSACVRSRERGRRRPESAVRACLTVMDGNLEAVEKAPMNKP